MDITLNPGDEGPLYIQLYKRVKTLIQNGNLQGGAKLPSVRALCRQLGVSKTTVETAYQMLLEEGYASSKPRSGLYVIDYEHRTFAKAKRPNNKEKKRSAEPQAPMIDFSLLTVDGESFPIRQWRSALAESLAMNGRSIHEYGDPRGEYGLREQLARYLTNSRGAVCTAEQIVVGTGISNSIHILSRLLGDGAAVGVEEYGIAQIRTIFEQHRIKLVPIPNDDDHKQPNLAQLERNPLQALYMTPSHRPAGSPLPYKTRQLLLQWAQKGDRYIIEDDYDGEFRYDGKTIPSLQGMDRNDSVIYLGTFSKSFTPALRMSYMVLPIELMERLNGLAQILTCPSRIDQWAMGLFIEKGHWYRHIRKMRLVYRRKLERIIQCVERHMPGRAEVTSDRAGLHIELTLQAGCSAERLIELAAASGVRVYGLQSPGMRGHNEKPKIYLGFGGIDDSDMERGIQMLSEAWSTVWG
ncbi:MocR-like pyridoxine biosynthesis transcription factor PdxR [Paenibacillus harenae]|uniref:MocR-like pyridoxine biosynthesis transcription factor PdxR n=1 Tax=Paenibacillus harenae TaxID=306543 RepID=UPI00278E0951|nr:PLP-dependent aminotransferase family protein [Paenibacillus harenae]MDQ0062227.1 GntR family transcriptional regulator/MocR family aminotransferase [Paenibacillus harenae]